MVWSDQSQFPFYVIDNNGNIILTIDSTGLHLVGPLGRIDAVIDGSGQPTIFFSDPTNTGHAFINAPISGTFAALGLDSDAYNSGLLAGSPNIRTRSILGLDTLLLEFVKTAGQVPVGSRIAMQTDGLFISFRDVNSDIRATILLTDGSITFRKDGASTQTVFYDVPAAAFKVGGNGSGWTTLTLANGWSNLGSPYNFLDYGLTPSGNVRMRGVVTSGTKTDGTVIATLPAGFRPPNDKLIGVGNGSGGTVNNPNARIRAATGNIEIFGMAAATSGAHSYDGVEFERF